MVALNGDLDTIQVDRMTVYMQTELPQLPQRIVEDGSAILEEEMRAAVPVRTGRLKNSIQRIIGMGFAIIKTNTGYGKFVDEGTLPHVIEGNPILRFELNDIVLFRHRVRHPGFPGRFFTLATIRNATSRLEQMVQDRLADFAERGTGLMR